MALSVCSGLGCLPRRGSLVPGWAKLRVSQTLDPLQSLTKQELDAGQGGTHGLGRGIDPPPAPPPISSAGSFASSLPQPSGPTSSW